MGATLVDELESVCVSVFISMNVVALTSSVSLLFSLSLSLIFSLSLFSVSVSLFDLPHSHPSDFTVEGVAQTFLAVVVQFAVSFLASASRASPLCL